MRAVANKNDVSKLLGRVAYVAFLATSDGRVSSQHEAEANSCQVDGALQLISNDACRWHC